MKNIKYLFILLILYSFALPNNTKLGNSGIITYKLIPAAKKHQPKYTDKEQESFFHAFIHKTTDAAKDLVFILKFNQKESLYMHEEGMPDETIDPDFYHTAILHGGDGKFYQNRYENINLRQYIDSESDQTILVTDKLIKPNKWKILKETDTILGYKTIKAQSVTNKKIFVWFAPDIPVPFGPNRLCGLPGIILRTTDGYFTIEAASIKFSKKSIDIKRPTKGRQMTYQQKRAWDAERIAKMHSINNR